jgi:hypothetical protein
MVNLRNALLAVPFAFCAIAVAACNGGPTYAIATPGPTCQPGGALPQPVSPQLVYPKPGATGVPDDVTELVFAVASPLPNAWNAYINTSSSLNGASPTANGMVTISASAVPSPAASPAIPNPVYQSITFVSTLPPGATIYVWLNNTATACTPLGPLGSFSTQ